MDTLQNISLLKRVFHWMLASSFVVLSITGLTQIDYAHILFGHLLFALVITRIVFGVFAKKSDLFLGMYFYKIKELLHHLKELFSQPNNDIHIHNPAGGYMILTMLVFLIITLSTGLLSEGVIEFSGIFSFLANEFDNQAVSAIKLAHKVSSYILLGLSTLHVTGVLFSSYKSKKNLSLMMINGHIK